MNNATRISVIQDRERWDLPRIINLNAWSLNIEKRDERQIIVEELNMSIVCATESWFKEYITDDCTLEDPSLEVMWLQIMPRKLP